MKKSLLRFMGILALVGSNGCLPTYDASTPQGSLPPAQASGPQMAGAGTSSAPPAVRPENPANGVTVWDQNGDPSAVAAAAQNAGPLDVSARKHACMKMKFDTLGRLLASHGVDLTTGGTTVLPVSSTTDCSPLSLQGFNPDRGVSQVITVGADQVIINSVTEKASYLAQIAQPAKFLYCDARLTLGLPQYGARLSEATAQSTASGTKLFDLFASAAPEMVKNLMTAPACQYNGQPAVLFNPDNSCNEAGVTCLQGYPATDDQVALCTRLVQQASATADNTVTLTTLGTGTDLNTSEIVTVPFSTRKMTVTGASALETGKRLAVAAILSAVHGCE